MKILLLGKHGQIGWELQRSLAPLGDVVALDRHSTDAEGGCGDLTRLDRLHETVRRLHPDVIVNAAAHTAVDRAESEPDLARRVNTLAPGVLADAARSVSALLVHYSTDYVFDGSGRDPWREDAPTAPLSVYGTTKLDGEKRVRASGARHLMFRTSWVYAARGSNFARTILRLAQERERLTVIDDQWGAPTGAELIADVTAHAIRETLRQPARAGTYHLCAAGETSWNGYARFVLETARALKPEQSFKAREVVPVSTSAFPTPARRPLNSRLDTALARGTFGLTLPDWRFGVRRMLTEILCT